MNKLALILTVLLVLTSSTVAQNDYLCKKICTSSGIATQQVQEVLKPAHTVTEYTEPVFDTGIETVLSEPAVNKVVQTQKEISTTNVVNVVTVPAHTIYNCDDASFSEQKTVIVTVSGCTKRVISTQSCDGDANCDIFCSVAVPEETTTIITYNLIYDGSCAPTNIPQQTVDVPIKVVTQAAEFSIIEVPPAYTTIKKQILITPAVKVEKFIPATYYTYEKLVCANTTTAVYDVYCNDPLIWGDNWDYGNKIGELYGEANTKVLSLGYESLQDYAEQNNIPVSYNRNAEVELNNYFVDKLGIEGIR